MFLKINSERNPKFCDSKLDSFHLSFFYEGLKFKLDGVRFFWRGVSSLLSLRWLKLISTLYGKAFNTALEYEEVFMSFEIERILLNVHSKLV